MGEKFIGEKSFKDTSIFNANFIIFRKSHGFMENMAQIL